MAKQIDFKFVKETSGFLDVLKHYEVNPKGAGVSRTIPCPFHKEKTPSCKVNLGRKIFHCFGCDAQGNILDFVRRMEELAEDDLRGAARKLAQICGIPTAPPAGGGAEDAPRRARKPVEAPEGPDPAKNGVGPPLASWRGVYGLRGRGRA